MNHGCNCETEGFCTFCRSMPKVGDARKASMSEVPRPYTLCHWCEKDITYLLQYTLGNFNDNKKVCGVNCPKRKAQSKPKKREYEVDVRGTIVVYAASASEAHARATAAMKDTRQYSTIGTTRVVPLDDE